MASARTTKVGMDYNVVEIVEGELSFAQNYLAELRSMPIQRYSVGVNAASPPDDLSSPLFQLVNDTVPKEQLTFNQEKDLYTLSREGEELVVGKYNREVIISQLERVARWYRILASHNAHPEGLNYEDFPMTFRVLDENGLQKTLIDSLARLELVSEKGKYFSSEENAWAIPYEITAQNQSEYEVYFALLHFDPLYGIEVYYNGVMPAHTQEILLVEGYGLFPDEKMNLTTNWFKLIVSTQELHSYLFTQLPIQQVIVKEDNKRTSTKISEDWLAKSLEVVLTKNI